MGKIVILTAALLALGTAAHANCPSSPPFSPNLASGDQAVNAAWLEENLAGRQLAFDEGREVYNADGSYSYIAGDQRYDASSYRFYNNGVRCIGYSQPRFDYYVVNDGSLVLVNAQGNRFVGRLSN